MVLQWAAFQDRKGGHLILLILHLYAGNQKESEELSEAGELAGETLALADGIDNAMFLATLYS